MLLPHLSFSINFPQQLKFTVVILEWGLYREPLCALWGQINPFCSSCFCSCILWPQTHMEKCYRLGLFTLDCMHLGWLGHGIGQRFTSIANQLFNAHIAQNNFTFFFIFITLIFFRGIKGKRLIMYDYIINMCTILITYTFSGVLCFFVQHS